jgi:nicotinamidase-related amidase
VGKPVLLVIDMLNDFFEEGPLAERRADLVRSINDLVNVFRRGNLPIIWVRQEFAPDLNDAFLELRKLGKGVTIAGTKGCQILPELDCRPKDYIIVKRRYSAFWGTGLDGILSAQDPDPLVVAGVNTHACVRTTVIDAYQRDYHIVLALDCIASYDSEHHDVTMRYLDGKMAQALRNAEVSKLLASSRWDAGSSAQR